MRCSQEWMCVGKHRSMDIVECEEAVYVHTRRVRSSSLLVILGWAVVPTHSLAPASLFLVRLLIAAVAGDAATACALASAFLLIQRAQRLASECEVVILNDDWADP